MKEMLAHPDSQGTQAHLANPEAPDSLARKDRPAHPDSPAMMAHPVNLAHPANLEVLARREFARNIALSTEAFSSRMEPDGAKYKLDKRAADFLLIFLCPFLRLASFHQEVIKVSIAIE